MGQNGAQRAIKELRDNGVFVGRWIPVSERLPEKSGYYWCTFGGTNLTGRDYYTTKSDAEKLFDEPEEYTGWRSQNVVAWMPLPLPWKGE